MRHLLIACLFVTMAVKAQEASFDLIGPNALSNAGFEGESGMQGWTASVDGGATVELSREIFLDGQHSLALVTTGAKQSAGVISEAVKLKPGLHYLVAVSYRQGGFGVTGDSYRGTSSFAKVTWLNEEGRPIGSDSGMSRFPYGACGWDIRDALVKPPPEAASLQVEVHVSNNSVAHSGEAHTATVWLDSMQVRPYRPPPTPEWATGEVRHVVEGTIVRSDLRVFHPAAEVDWHSMGGAWSKVVADPEAASAQALKATADAGRGLMAHSPYYDAMPPGLYRLRMRVKVAETSSAKSVGSLDIASRFAGGRLLLPIVPAAFAEPGRYQEIERDFLLRDDSWWCMRFYTEGISEWQVDWIKVFPLHTFTDRELLTVYPGAAAGLPDELIVTRQRPWRVLFVAGLGYDWSAPTRILHLMDPRMEITPAWCRRDRNFSIDGMPESAEELFAYNLVVLANVHGNALGIRHRLYLNSYIERGGALLVLGGPQSLERGKWQGSLLEEALPVRAMSSFDSLLHRAEGWAITLEEKLPWLRESDTSAVPLAYFLHRVELTESAQLFARAGEHPFLVGAEVGRGRVVCVLGWPMGEPGPEALPYWQWEDWPYLMRNALWWALRY